MLVFNVKRFFLKTSKSRF